MNIGNKKKTRIILTYVRTIIRTPNFPSNQLSGISFFSDI